uniref:Uncharacterized protein n=1 Tax=Microcebus murinus TaxID=30608 RepID=A0A8C5XXT2_MICMU
TPRVTVKDVNQQEFVRALAAFLKTSGKLKVPRRVDTVKLAKHKEFNLYLWGGAGVGSMTKISREHQINGVTPSHSSQASKSVAHWGLKIMEKDQNGGHKLTPQGQRDLDRIARQVAAANKKH